LHFGKDAEKSASKLEDSSRKNNKIALSLLDSKFSKKMSKYREYLKCF
jgi:hypothetical protein